ncbi:hypothetical protein AcV5_005913 [Taiwanofungus camphoratus]|nr:hypothetical protein AcV5_005913 [Antrodia cinnamomea]
MPTADNDPGKIWLETPLTYSPHISSRLGSNAYLKLENLQPSHSFKYRGISHFIQRALREHGSDVHLIIASGGNAGLAAAATAKALRLRCTVYLPEGVGASTVGFLKQAGAEVITEGKIYLHALKKAEEVVKGESNAVMVPAYDDPILWQGHSSIIHEITRQLPPGTRPDAIFCSVGGGGLSAGIMKGCKSVGWDNVPLIALETVGCDCFYHSLALNPGVFTKSPTSHILPEGARAESNSTYGVNIVHLAALTSRATCLGASSPAPAVVKMALERKGGVKSVCVPDELAMQTTLDFAEDHKMLVELACSATLTPAYKPALFDKLVPPSSSGTLRTVVFIVCGGFKVSLEEMVEYRDIVDADVRSGGHWEVLCNGERWVIDK